MVAPSLPHTLVAPTPGFRPDGPESARMLFSTEQSGRLRKHKMSAQQQGVEVKPQTLPVMRGIMPQLSEQTIIIRLNIEHEHMEIHMECHIHTALTRQRWS